MNSIPERINPAPYAAVLAPLAAAGWQIAITRAARGFHFDMQHPTRETMFGSIEGDLTAASEVQCIQAYLCEHTHHLLS